MKRAILLLLIVSIPFLLSAQTNKAGTAPSTLVGVNRPKNLSDSALLDLVQKQTFKYFWDFAYPVSGLARERSNETSDYGHEVVTTGGSGFGIMAIIVATDRKW